MNYAISARTLSRYKFLVIHSLNMEGIVGIDILLLIVLYKNPDSKKNQVSNVFASIDALP